MSDPDHKGQFIDMMEEEFVNSYVNKFDPEVIEWYPYGAPKVPEIDKLLVELYKKTRCPGIDIIVIYGRTVIRDGFTHIFWKVIVNRILVSFVGDKWNYVCFFVEWNIDNLIPEYCKRVM